MYEHKARLFLLKSLSAKLQKLDQDVYEALTMVMIVVENLITTLFPSWYSEILKLAV